MGLSIIYLKGSQVAKFPNSGIFLSLKIVLTSAKSADPDEMQHYAVFHLSLHCLPKYTFRVSRKQRGLKQLFVLFKVWGQVFRG